MKTLDFLIKKAGTYNLIAEYVNENTIKVYSPKFFFDSWLIVEQEKEVELWHMSKKNSLKKCSYHLQATVSRRKSIRALQKINDHNNYTAFYKKRNKVNLVDRVLQKGVGRYEKLT